VSIHELAVRGAAYLARELKTNRIQENRMAFGLELFLGEILKLSLIITLSYILGILPEVLTITVTANILRLASGGEHCSAYYRCLIGGTLCFIFLGGIVHILNPFLANADLRKTALFCFLISSAILWKYAPGDTVNKPINSEDEKARFKKWSFIIVLGYFMIMVGMTFLETSADLVLPISVGMMEQTFTVTPMGYRFIHFVDNILGNEQ